MKTKVVPRPRLSWSERLYLGPVVKGLGLTLQHFFGVMRDLFRWSRKKTAITMQYPEERWELKDNFRGAPALVKDQFGREKCVACQICEFVCPPRAITIWPAEFADPNKVEKYPERFEIDMLRCIYCGLCEEACPEEAIFCVKEAELVHTDKQAFVHDKEKLYELGGIREDGILKWQRK
ncbi:MAG: NuoI/complex I 23 kDa subunit family protein [Planctomycetota bacterium]